MSKSRIKRVRDDSPQMLKARAIVEAHISYFGMVPHPDKLKEAIASALQSFNSDTDWQKAKVSIDVDTHFDGHGMRVFGRVVDWQPEDYHADTGRGIGLRLLCEYESDNFGMLARPWQPIETAPTDGTWILIWEIAGINTKYSPADVAHYHLGDWYNADEQRLHGASHWMPLPTPPNAEGR